MKPLVMLSVAGMLAFNAAAQSNNSNMNTSATGATKVDGNTEKMDEKNRKVVGDLIGANTYQIKLLELTQQKAKDQMLKDAAGQMLPDYRKMGDELTQWASRHGYSTAATEAKKYDGKISKWSNHNQGLELDYDLGEELRDVNKDNIDMFKNAKEDTKDAELKSWIDGAVATMEQHKSHIDGLKHRAQKPWKEGNRPDPKMGNKNKSGNASDVSNTK